jgi:pyrroloquinoline quinone (PQQ) biosynthesis protein C
LNAAHLTARRNLLDHTFYRRWVAGDLSMDELRYYACQYSHVVSALPGWLRRAAAVTPAHAAELNLHAAEEDSHIVLWHRFAYSLGITGSELAIAAPNAATANLLDLGTELSGQPAGVAVAWALEAQTPAVSAEKLTGLSTHYGIGRDNGGEYFDLHGSLDVVHAAELDEVIAGLGADQVIAAQQTADAVLDGLWDLLTSSERAA